MEKSIFEQKRNSYLEPGEIYFWTATINSWHHLLKDDRFKDVIIESLSYLSDKGKIDVFAFVVMPNHIHLIWRINKMNGQEMPHGSFLKYTAHEFKKLLKQYRPEKLPDFKVNKSNREYEFWQRDPLAIHIYSREVALQKLDYLHNNPLAEHWNLVNDPCDYQYSSCRYYELGQEDFVFLKDLMEEV